VKRDTRLSYAWLITALALVCQRRTRTPPSITREIAARLGPSQLARPKGTPAKIVVTIVSAQARTPDSKSDQARWVR